MKKKLTIWLSALMLLLSGCGAAESTEPVLPDSSDAIVSEETVRQPQSDTTDREENRQDEQGVDEEPDPSEPPAPLPEQAAERRERDEAVRSAVEELDPADRELFLRFYYLGQTVEEIAAVTGRNPSTLKSRLRRGREKLKRDLTEKGVC